MRYLKESIRGRRLLFGCLMMVMGLSVRAQQSFTLKQTIDYAETHSLLLGTSRVELDKNVFLEKNLVNNLIPTLTFNSNLGGLWGRSIDPTTNNFTTNQTIFQTLGLQSSITLLSSSTFNLSKQIAKSNTEIARYRLENQLMALKANIILSYLNMVGARAKAAMTERSIEFYAKQVRVTDTLIAYQRRTLPDKIRFQQQISSDSVTLLRQQSAIQEAMIQLQGLADHQADVTYDNTDINDTTANGLFDYIQQVRLTELESAFLKDHPGVKEHYASINLNKTQLRIAKRAWVPAVSISLGLGSNYSDNYFLLGRPINYFEQVIRNNISQSVFINLSLPILNHNANKRSIYQAEAGIRQQVLESESNVQQLRTSIRSAYNDAYYAFRSYQQSNISLRKIEALVDLNTRLFKTNRLSVIDFIQSARELNSELLNNQDLRTTALFKIILLKFYASKNLNFL
ncbi:hypothetical protein C7T94_03870 [Pedobacter yulinensis]|uniref:TolC family protein n=1 Tax=Pedobacter yulinensis TaxID=2126353 RepID=A0A2T3HNC6_9SPHI|nr:TolC family protein [Pedobacter yulinensis]PST83893.1 hypothetical protein C7T94_03870 [Pedobacter yulinensis]